MEAKRKLRFCRIAAVLFLSIPVTTTHLRGQQNGSGSARVAFSHALPLLNGDKLAVNVVEVTYGPGEASAPHSHPCPVIAYVAEGEIRSRVEGKPESTYKAGDSFYEEPNGVHAVSANASNVKPAKLVAFFVCDHAGPLSTPAERTHK
jgi:quercetin dioxygenase-like cupin family protein